MKYLQELESIKARMGGQSKLIVADKEMLKVLALAARIAKGGLYRPSAGRNRCR